MEATRNELEFDELEKLLYEIPKVTAPNPNSGGSVPRRVILDDQSPVKGVGIEEMNLPEDGFNLASAFSEMSFSGVPMEAGNAPLAKSLQSYPSSLDGRLSNNEKKQTFPDVNSPLVVVPSFRTPSNVPYGFYGFDAPKAGHEGTNLSRFNNHSRDLIRRHQVSNYQPIENFSASVPVPYLSNVAVPGMQFPLMSDHQQTFMEPQPRLPYLNPQQANQQHHVSWRNTDEEQLYEMQLQYLNLQRIHDQQFKTNNITSRFVSLNLRQPQDVPISNEHEQVKQEPFWSGYTMPRGPNQSNTGFSSVELSAIRAWDKMGRQNYPERVFGRSQGLNVPNGMKFGSFGINEPFNYVVQNGKVLPHGGHILQTVYSSGSYQFDNVRSWDLHPDPVVQRSFDLKPVPLIGHNSLNEVTGRIYLMARDQYGCRFLQRKFAEGTRDEVEMIFSEIIDHIVDLMTDPFGNYLVQKLLEVCNEDQHMKILHSITRTEGELVRVSCDMHGTRAVQKIIETLKTTEQFSVVVSSLKHNAVALMKNMNGNHVAQKCLQHLMPEFSDFLFEAATGHCVELATDRHGCCVLQKCLGHSEGERRSRLICEIAANSLILSQDPFGNYVVQFVFDLKLAWATDKILDNMDGSFADLSVQKHSSNVVERCLKSASEERRTRIIQELIDNPRLDQIMQDPFGNYVTQAALEKSKGIVYAKLVDAIKPYIAILRTSPYGKKVLTRLSSKK